MKQQVTLTQEQVQKLSVGQLQSLQILSMSTEDLQDMLQKESEENPFMEYRPSSSNDGTAEFLHFIAAPEQDKIKKFILEQLNPSQFSKPAWALMSYLAQAVDERGYLTVSEKELCQRIPLPDGLFSACLATLQSLEPAGICAMSVSDCLKLQLRRLHRCSPLAEAIIDQHLDDIAAGRLQTICQMQNISKKTLSPILRLIRSLDPSPLKGLFSHDDDYVVPDVIIRLTDDGYETILNDSWTASYSISDYYIQMMRQTTDPDVKTYFRQKYERCYLLLHNIERRRQTLCKLSDAIWKWQYAYTRQYHSLRPMTLHDIAQETGLHISTISRAIRGKYIQTPWRTYAFKTLFQAPLGSKNRPLSKEQVKLSLKKFIDSEDQYHPYSDSQLAALLSRQYRQSISRRVIQKYRSLLRIPSSYIRRLS